MEGRKRGIKRVKGKGKPMRIKRGMNRINHRASYNKSYNLGFDTAYNEGFNIGYTEGMEAGHQEAYKGE